MIPAYWMVLVNIISSIFLILGILTYRFIYPKRQINLLVLLILISLLPIISIFRAGVYESGDLFFHITEEMIFYKSLSEGIIVPVWGGDMNGTYGYPLFMFFYPLPFYLMSIFHFIGFSFINSVKLLLGFAYIFSGIFIYLWLKKILNKTSAFVGALFYLFAPYHLIDLHFRADIGEVLAFVFIPLCLLAATTVIQTKNTLWFFIEAISIACLLLSHPAISFEAIPAIFLYCIFLIKNPIKNIRQILIQVSAFLSGFLLTAYYSVPLFYNLQYIYLHTLPPSYVTFVTLQQLLYSPYRLGLLFQGPHGELAFILGYAQLLVFILAFLLLYKKHINKKYMPIFILSLLIVIVTVFMMLSIAKPLWLIIPLIKNFQFSYRLLGITIFALAVIAAVVTECIKKNWLIIFLSSFVILSTILNWGNRKTIPQITDQVIFNKLPQEASMGGGLAQGLTIWSDPKNPWISVVPKKNIEIINGRGTIKELTRQINLHKYIVSADTPLQVRENTVYFPNWHVFIDKKIQHIAVLSSTKPRGIISFTIPKGKHIVEVIFQDTPEMIFGKIVSIITFIILLIIAIFDKKFAFLFTFKKQKK